MIVLGVYVLFVGGHVVWSVGTGWSSGGWAILSEVVALVLRSNAWKRGD